MRRSLLLGLALLFMACAATSRNSGVSDGIAWEVQDVVANPKRGGWDYTIVLTERSGVPIQFEREEFGGFIGGTVTRGPTTLQFGHRLAPNSTLRLRTWSNVSGVPGAPMLWRRFIGRDPAGRPVTVDVRFYPDALARRAP